MECLLGLLMSCLTVCSLSSAYPIYGPKRYRAFQPMSQPVYRPRPYPPAYHLGGQELQDIVDIYSQDPYNSYYQLPYYFPEATPYFYDDEELQEDQDLGEEEMFNQDWYSQDGNAKANAYFLQNLILAQMYKDAQSRFPISYGYPAREESSYPEREDYEDFVYGQPVVEEEKEDEEVKELKTLVDSKADSAKRRQLKKKILDSKTPRFTDNRWSAEKRSTEKKGQDEVVMPRPATPVRSPAFHQRSHEPSPYDAIKKLLNNQPLHQKTNEDRQPQKRSYIPNEDALVEQLGNLKKSA